MLAARNSSRIAAANAPCRSPMRLTRTTRVSPTKAVELAQLLPTLQSLLADPMAAAAAAAGLVPVVGGAALAANNKGASSLGAAAVWAAVSADESATVLVDVRNKAEAKEQGNPDFKGVKGKRLVALAATQLVGDELVAVEDFAAKLAALPAIGEEAQLVVLDADGSLAQKVAAALAASDALPQKKVGFVAGGAEAWQAAELPWKEPSAGFSLPNLSLPGLSLPELPASLDEAADRFNANPSALSALASVAAAAGTAAFVIAEFDVLLELAGVVGLGFIAYKNLLFADDRKRSLAKIKEVAAETGADKAASELAVLAGKVVEAVNADASGGATPAAATPAGAGAAAASSSNGSGSPSSIEEAKAWIEDWRAKNGGSSDAPVPENVAAARQWIAEYKQRTGSTA